MNTHENNFRSEALKNFYKETQETEKEIPITTEQPSLLDEDVKESRPDSCTCICADTNSSCLYSSSRYNENNQSTSQELQDLILNHPDLQYLNTDLLSDGIFSFALSFIRNHLRLAGERAGENLVFSPLSVHAILSILTSAASPDSQTQIELLNSLGTLNNINSLETLYASLFEDYSRMGETLKIANGIWSPPSLKPGVNTSFIDHISKVYQSTYEFLDADVAKDNINYWVNNRTNGKIKSLFDEVAEDFILLLANVVYFKDSWTIKFEEPFEDEDNYFTLMDGKKVKAKMMERSSLEFQTGIFDYGRIKNIKTVNIPYEGFDRRFEMVLIVPENHRELGFIQAELLSFNSMDNIFQMALASLTTDYDYYLDSPTVVLPEFLIETKLNLNEILKKMGIRSIFSDASLDKIGHDLTLKVSQVQHKAILEVNKHGTEGAASTGIEVIPLIGNLGAPTSVKANVPFLFFIHDKQRKIPLFMGQVMDPRV
ncbi:unnamed protein product [Lepeophtheirus salmonis]|uniref:(salmon louse) hypothetical protein n=1 Tax=Lepeophtheirus salmonis TaxID=72036 RepID=A0A7R8HBP8_LEPSM|nr:unnamed protein product [Lepeophtheirus salmonis]CAF2993050.1 unnamed protein product [Lepeophtheirus salmonis]